MFLRTGQIHLIWKHVHNIYQIIKPNILIPKSIIKYFEIVWEHEWKACDEPDKHMAYFKIGLTILSRKFVFATYQFGPATDLSNMEINIFGKMNFPVISAMIILSPLRLKTHFSCLF